jgi:hypothetical protein
MSRSTARAAVAAFFAPPAVPKLNGIKAGLPKLTEAGDWFSDTSGSGALGFIHIERQMERRIAIGGATSGVKLRVYDFGLVVILRSAKPHGEDATTDNDSILDHVVAHLQADRTLGGSVFQAGEGDTFGEEDIEVASDLPQMLDGGIVQIWNVVRFKVLETLQT